MGVTKSDLFTAEQNEMASIAKVFAHPARMAIIDYLLRSNACINSDLVEELGLAQPTISQHLNELKNVGIITGSIEGNSISYCIHESNWMEIKNRFEEMFNRYKGVDCC